MRTVGDSLREQRARYSPTCSVRILYTCYLLITFLHCLSGAETGDPHAVMHWTVKFFHERVFRRYECALRGWPGWIVFQNLSRVSVGELYELIRHCQSGELYFSPITRNEYEAVERHYTAAAPGPLFPASPPNYGYCNIGRRFVPTNRIQDGPKSAKEVDEVETAVPTVTEGFPIIMKDSACLVWSSSGYRDFIHGCEDPEDPIDDW